MGPTRARCKSTANRRGPGEHQEVLLGCERDGGNGISNLLRPKLLVSFALEAHDQARTFLGDDIDPVLLVALTAETRHRGCRVQIVRNVGDKFLQLLRTQVGDRQDCQSRAHGGAHLVGIVCGRRDEASSLQEVCGLQAEDLRKSTNHVPTRAGVAAFPAADRLLAYIAKSTREFRLVPPVSKVFLPDHASSGVQGLIMRLYCVR